MKQQSLCIILTLLCCGSTTVYANVEPQTQLAKTQITISSIQQQQKIASDALEKLERDLQTSDAGIGKLAKQKRELDTRLQTSNTTLADLQQQLTLLESQSKVLQQQLVTTFRWHYKLGHEPALKLLFSTQNFHDRMRDLRLLQLLFKNEQQDLKALKEKQQAIAETTTKLQQEQQQLAELKASLELQNKQLLQSKRQQDSLIASRRAIIKKSNNELEILQANERDLKKLITQMAAAAAAAAAEKQQAEKHQSEKVQIGATNPSKLPVQGRIVTRYGQRGDHNLTVSKGLFIAAKEGAEVTAPKAGTVIFSDWLRGYGYLVIVDHGSNYLTLYGHNQTLLKKNRDSVKAGEVIARAGRSGGSEQPGLYFEVRFRGEAINPERWMKEKT